MSRPFSDQVKQVLQGENITPEQLDYMIEHAAISSLRGADRRYRQWLFVMSATGEVVEMFKYVTGDEHFEVWHRHDDCAGYGCKECGWKGEIPVR